MRRCAVTLTLIILACAVAVPSAAAAEGNGSLAGTVMTTDGRGLVGAVIALFRQDDSGAIVSLTRSDQRGIYGLDGIAPGSYSLRVSRYGYQVLNSPRVTIGPGKTTTVNFVLQQLLDFISASHDPRNWDLKTVMRSTSDRRLIFRDLPGIAAGEERAAVFHRSGTLSIVSGELLSESNYARYPNRGDTGLTSNFAFVEPVSQRGRMIFSGQLTSGSDSLWRVRNTFDYRPDPNRDWKFSVGYGRLNPGSLTMGTLARPALFFERDPSSRDSGVETLAVGFQARNQFSDSLALEYGVDLCRINYGPTKSVLSPYLQLAVAPYHGWLLRTMMTSRRIDANSIVDLPDGETLNLLEPAYISEINNQIRISQVRHSELSVARKLAEDTTLEVTVYRDRADGPGTPFLMTTSTKGEKKSTAAVQLREDQDAQQGLRVGFTRVLMDSVRGSVTYDYGTAAGLSSLNQLMPSDVMATRLLDFIQRSYYHSISSQLEAKIPQTRTHVQATLRWYPGDPLSPIDQFADRMDAVAKGMSFSLRQVIPVPEFMGCPGRWEARIDVRNPFDQGMNRIPTSDGELILARSPRTVRFGLNLNFF
jgi:hypothetical protein